MIRASRGSRACREIPASKETRGARDCQVSQAHGGSQGPLAELETKALLAFLVPLDPRDFQETSAPLGTMAQKAPRVSLELEACRDPVGSWGLRVMRDPRGHQGPPAWRVCLEGRDFLGGLAWMAQRGSQGILDGQGPWVNRGFWDSSVWLESQESWEKRVTVA